ncbi:MAG: DUF2894 domain-containing protein [Pseudomonadales bacterium]|nr:DUF2894 domain-containing protein [Pseudomonadales bacterium]
MSDVVECNLVECEPAQAEVPEQAARIAPEAETDPTQSESVSAVRLSPRVLESLDIEAFHSVGLDKFDPGRFRYIEAMSEKAASQSAGVAARLKVKIEQARAEYLSAFLDARERLDTQLRTAQEQSSALAPELGELFDRCEFTVLKRRLTSTNDALAKSLLSGLREQLASRELDVSPAESGSPFEMMLREQEAAALREFGDSSIATTQTETKPEAGEIRELASVKQLRDSMAKRGSERLVTQAVKTVPEDPGPLNPQMLVTRSLSAMRSLSPEYLNRFVSYLDSLFWLEQAGARQESDKTVPASGSKKTKRKTA